MAPGTGLNLQYREWLRQNELTPERRAAIAAAIDGFAHMPLISVVTPVYNTEPGWLVDALESVRGQLYPNWELCLADDGSTRSETHEVLRRYEDLDARIKVSYLEDNRGIVGASNAALELARGEYIALFDHDDELKPDALYEVVARLNERSGIDYIYSDEDKRDETGALVEPYFKPDWSPDLLMSQNYLNHLSVIRRALLEEVGPFRAGYDGSQDYDLFLRVTEAAREIVHIPRPLYTWRKVAGSAAASEEAKPYAYVAAKKALEAALERRGLSGEVLDGATAGHYRVRYDIAGGPKVSIVIPTKDRVDLLRRAIDSARARTAYRNLEFVIVDNGSSDRDTLIYLSEVDAQVISYPHEFNFSRMVNLGAEAAGGEYILLLNNDTEAVADGWLEAMLEHAQRGPVGPVGARLLYGNGDAQHEGILTTVRPRLPSNLRNAGYFGLSDDIRNVSAVTAACLMVRAAIYEELGAFDEELAVAYNDVDFCLRARESGYLCVYTPYATVYHHEGASRGRVHPAKDERRFRAKWGHLTEDPYYNPNLDLRYPYNLRLEKAPDPEPARDELASLMS